MSVIARPSKVTVAPATANAITSLPATLARNVYWTSADVTNSRTITITGGQAGTEFSFNNLAYDPNRNNFSVRLNAIERWTITSQTPQGQLWHLKPVLKMSETMPYWDKPTVPLGYHRPVWPG